MTVNYVGVLYKGGKVFDASWKRHEPFVFALGKGAVIPGWDQGIAGMKVGEEKRLKVKAQDAYGQVDPRGIQEVPKEKVPANGLKVGAVLMAGGPEGQTRPVTVKEIKEKTVVIDMNHPMAGKNLVFDVKVLDIQPSPPAQPPQASQPSAPPQPAKPAQAK